MQKHIFWALVATILISVTFNLQANTKPLSQKIEAAKQLTKKVNINTANKTELQRLPGIGAKKAAAIIQFRQQKGKFKSLKDLTKIKGIGNKMLAKLSANATVG